MQHADLWLRRRFARVRNQRGISFVEVLVATLLGVIVVGTVNSFSRFQLFSLRNQAAQNDVQMVARSVSDIFARDVRRSGFNPQCGAGMDALGLAKPGEVLLNADHDGDGALGGVDESLLYRFVANGGAYRFERVANGRADLLIDGVDPVATRFRYFDGNGAELNNGVAGLSNAEMALIRRIRLELAISASSADPSGSVPVQVQIANDVDIRNRHFVNPVTCP